jgi:hypothetical protein
VLREALFHAQLNLKLQQLRAKGVDLVNNYYVLGDVAVNVDEPHKVKNLVQVRRFLFGLPRVMQKNSI